MESYLLVVPEAYYKQLLMERDEQKHGVMRKLQLMSDISFFQKLSTVQFNRIAYIASVEAFGSRKVLARGREPIDKLFFLIDGTVIVTSPNTLFNYDQSKKCDSHDGTSNSRKVRISIADTRRVQRGIISILGAGSCIGLEEVFACTGKDEVAYYNFDYVVESSHATIFTLMREDFERNFRRHAVMSTIALFTESRQNWREENKEVDSVQLLVQDETANPKADIRLHTRPKTSSSIMDLKLQRNELGHLQLAALIQDHDRYQLRNNDGAAGRAATAPPSTDNVFLKPIIDVVPTKRDMTRRPFTSGSERRTVLLASNTNCSDELRSTEPSIATPNHHAIRDNYTLQTGARFDGMADREGGDDLAEEVSPQSLQNVAATSSARDVKDTKRSIHRGSHRQNGIRAMMVNSSLQNNASLHHVTALIHSRELPSTPLIWSTSNDIGTRSSLAASMERSKMPQSEHPYQSHVCSRTHSDVLETSLATDVQPHTNPFVCCKNGQSPHFTSNHKDQASSISSQSLGVNYAGMKRNGIDINHACEEILNWNQHILSTLPCIIEGVTPDTWKNVKLQRILLQRNAGKQRRRKR
jgi:hypothetical protein